MQAFYRTVHPRGNHSEQPDDLGQINPITCCADNCEVKTCVTECNIQTCEGLITPPSSNCSTNCYPIYCHCAKGYYANKCFQCVKKEQCDVECNTPKVICPGQNEELKGCYDPRKAQICDYQDPAFDQLCRREDSPFPLDLLNLSGWNDKPGLSCIIQICDCKDGYKRNRCGICVEAAKCTKDCIINKDDKCSDPDEIRYDIWRPCEARTCKHSKKPTKCVKEWSRVYRNRCDCKDGYFHDDCGRCIPEHECSNPQPCKCTAPCELIKNSALVQLNSCTIRTCYTANAMGVRCKEDVSQDCNCNDGFWYNKDYLCVPKDNCTSEDIELTKQFIDPKDVIDLGTIPT